VRLDTGVDQTKEGLLSLAQPRFSSVRAGHDLLKTDLTKKRPCERGRRRWQTGGEKGGGRKLQKGWKGGGNKRPGSRYLTISQMGGMDTGPSSDTQNPEAGEEEKKVADSET